METLTIFSVTILAALITVALIWKKYGSRAAKKLPPSPWKLPIIGHLHHLAFSGDLPHHKLTKLSHKYGREMLYLQMGQTHTVVVSSRRLAKEIMRTQDISFANRADIMLGRIIFYNSTDIIFSPYGEYWRQLRKICTLELLSAKRVESFGIIRKDEALKLIASIKARLQIDGDDASTPTNMAEKLGKYSVSMVMRAALGDHVCEADRDEFLSLVADVVDLSSSVAASDLFPCLQILEPFLSVKGKMMKVRGRLDAVLDSIIKQHSARSENDQSEDLIDVILRVKESGDLEIPITGDFIKAVLLDIFSAGTDTSSTTAEWAMAEMIRHPDVMAKAQSEIRRAFGENRAAIEEETDIQELEYLKLVVKETLRLHPAAPLLVPRETREECRVDGYDIPAKTRVMVNAWAIGRDPEYWDDPGSFIPERFENSSVDFAGNHFEFIPFGAGRRMCPGMGFGLANVYTPLAFLLYHFDWELPDGLNPDDLDMSEAHGITVARQNNLILLPKLMN